MESGKVVRYFLETTNTGDPRSGNRVVAEKKGDNMVTQQTAMRRLAEKLRITSTKLNIREQIDSNKIEITEDFLGKAEGRVVEGRIDVRINGESIGYFYYGTGRKGARYFASRTLAFQAIKKQLPDYSYFLK